MACGLFMQKGENRANQQLEILKLNGGQLCSRPAEVSGIFSVSEIFVRALAIACEARTRFATIILDFSNGLHALLSNLRVTQRRRGTFLFLTYESNNDGFDIIGICRSGIGGGSGAIG
jgi:hypothetical protein